ncbi:MAG: exo-alpha-sialidase [Roseiflexaceae bacterium]|nr:exo-alpha-sialidase [Roseiflexaceae bacterium]
MTPSPLPTRPPYPTVEARDIPQTTVMQTIMRLPDPILSVDLAVHPLTNEPVVAAIAASMTTDSSPHAFVSAYDRQTKQWGMVQNIDTGATAIGVHRFRSVAVAVSGDGTITAVWGATAYPALEVWASTSRDKGHTWAAPVLLLANSFGVLDVAATLDGQIAVLALQREPVAPVIITGSPAGQWSAPDSIPVPSAWYATSGSVVVTGEGADARLVALTTAFTDAPGTAYLATRPVMRPGQWTVGSRSIGGDRLLGQVRGLAAAPSVVAFSFVALDDARFYVLASRDGGTTWGEIERLPQPAEASAVPIPATPFGAVAYDNAADRLVALWTCCEQARWGGKPATHYTAASRPGANDWLPQLPIPVISGAAAAADTVVAQAPNHRSIWLAWVEDSYTVAARALDLNRLLPHELYPTPVISTLLEETP